ncbi:MAG: DeoR family transcriptional regulator [Balneolaceae bacterium]|nr:DeoR family transcriptional regulator [Balneolaceae bacterium]
MITASKKKLLDLIKQQGQTNIDGLVALTDMAKTTVREHLTQLERDNYVERSYDRSGRGRPSLQFKLTTKGNGLYPSYEPQLMRELIRFLQAEEEEELLETFFEKFWDRRYKKLELMMETSHVQTEEEKADVLKDMLDEEGFMPEYEIDPQTEKLTVKECNCPFREVIKVTNSPCRLEKEFYTKVFGKNVDRTSHIRKGDFSCTYCIG